jgi:ribosome-associated protein
MATPETRRQLLAAVQACEDKKGEDTRILELDPADSGLADFFLITSASNDRQVVAIADEIEFRLKKDFGLYATSVEGRRQAEWILLDYTDIVIHVFLAEKRAFYDIERLRKSARNLTGAEIEADLKSALAKKTLAVRKSSPKSAGPLTKQVIPKTASSRKTSSKERGPNVTAKKAAKKAVKKSAAKAVKAVPATKKQAAKKSSPKVAKKAVPAAKQPIAKRVVAPTTATALAPPSVVSNLGAKPPVVKCEAPPEMLNLAASEAPAPKAPEQSIRKRR